MRIPTFQQYILLFFAVMLSYTMSMNSVNRICRTINVWRNGPLSRCFSFINSNSGSKRDRLNVEKVYSLNSYPSYDPPVNTVSTYPVGYNTVDQQVQPFGQVPNYNYNVVPNQYGFQPSIPFTLNSYGAVPYSRPNYFNNYNRPFRFNRRPGFRRYTMSSKLP